MGIHLMHVLSAFVFLLLCVGVANRRRRWVHIPLMSSAMAIDLAMVLYIELARGAIQQAQAKMGPLMVVHIIISCLVLVLYGMQVYTGVRKARNRPSRAHAWVMPWLLTLRFGNLVTSWIVMNP
jgi:uncharacterized membrane protein YozB (DUF420 family)